eukprot:3344500-Rhodomonas_salina.1
MTGTHQSTVGRGTDATNLWHHDGRGVRNCILVCGLWIQRPRQPGGQSPTGKVEGGVHWSCSGWLQQDSLGLRWQAMLIPIRYRLWTHTHLRKGQENYGGMDSRSHVSALE